MPHSTVLEDDNFFYNKGKLLWSANYDFREQLEDSFRNQLEKSDLLQGFSLSADVMSGNGSLTSILIDEFIRDECPKAPILLFALEEKNKYSSQLEANDIALRYKNDLFELNQSLWLAQLSQQCNMVVPFDESKMQMAGKKGPAAKKHMLERYQGESSLFHSSSLQGLAMNSVLSTLLKDEEGKTPPQLGDVIQ